MTAQQALVTLNWFRCMDGGVDATPEDLQVIEECILPLLKDNDNIIPDNGMTYHQMYLQWTYHYLPYYKEDCI